MPGPGRPPPAVAPYVPAAATAVAPAFTVAGRAGVPNSQLAVLFESMCADAAHSAASASGAAAVAAALLQAPGAGEQVDPELRSLLSDLRTLQGLQAQLLQQLHDMVRQRRAAAAAPPPRPPPSNLDALQHLLQQLASAGASQQELQAALGARQAVAPQVQQMSSDLLPQLLGQHASVRASVSLGDASRELQQLATLLSCSRVAQTQQQVPLAGLLSLMSEQTAAQAPAPAAITTQASAPAPDASLSRLLAAASAAAAAIGEDNSEPSPSAARSSVTSEGKPPAVTSAAEHQPPQPQQPHQPQPQPLSSDAPARTAMQQQHEEQLCALLGQLEGVLAAAGEHQQLQQRVQAVPPPS